MSIYTGVGSSARALNKLYVGVGGQARQVTKAYVGVGGQARLIYNYGIPLSDLVVGRVIPISVGGTYRNFYVIHQGNPDTSIYDSSCNGTWLMGQQIYTTSMQYSPWGRTDCPMYKYMNDTFLNSIEAGVRNNIKQVKIPYAEGWTESKWHLGSNGASCKVFPLSFHEMFSSSSQEYKDNLNVLKNCYYGKDGALLSYFKDHTTAADRAAYNLSNVSSTYWLRSYYNGSYPGYIAMGGALEHGGYTNAKGLRPVFILPSSMTISPDTGRIQT